MELPGVLEVLSLRASTLSVRQPQIIQGDHPVILVTAPGPDDPRYREPLIGYVEEFDDRFMAFLSRCDLISSL
jgi:hypothetical protein